MARQYDYVPDEEEDLAPQQVIGGGGSTDDHPLAPPAHPMADTGITAVTLFDYQAADTDEISFEADEVITSIDMVSTLIYRVISQ